MSNVNIRAIFAIFHTNNPNPKTELIYHSPFELLVAVVLSAQATDTSVNKSSQVLFKIANTPYAMLKLGTVGLESYIKMIGLYKSKAKHIIGLCKVLVRDYGGRVPDTFEELVKLPGVGRKTANVILNTLYNQPTIAVDTHVFRVSNRIGLDTSVTPLGVEKGLMRIVPKQYLGNAHHWLVLHGRYICKARNPLCSECVINTYCKYYQNHVLVK